MERVKIRENYEVDREGNVYSKYKKLTPVKTASGYMQVGVGKKKVAHIHRLVAEAFIPNPKGHEVVNHIDNDKTNNTVGNLEWVTQADNIAHMVNQNRQAKGEKQHLAKLSEEIVLMIRNKHSPYDPVYGTRPLARKLGVSTAVINNVTKRKTWKHIL